MNKKRIFIFIALAFFLSGCLLLFFKQQNAVHTPKERILQTQINQIMITSIHDHIDTLTKDAERFNLSFLQKNVSAYGKYFEEYQEKAHIIITSWGENRYKFEFTPTDSYFTLVKFIDLKGVVRSKGYQFHNGGFDKGIWYVYDEKGFLIAEYNYDSLRKFTFEQVLQFCKENNISVNKGYVRDAFHETIIHYSDTSNIWQITYHDKITFNFKDIILNGDTGEVSEEREYFPEI